MINLLHRALLFALLIGFGLSGCNSSETTNPDGETPVDSTETPVVGDYVRVYVSSALDNLNPYTSNHADAAYVKELLFSYLLQVDPDNMANVNELVTGRAEVSGDKSKFTFTIHEDAVWDNGDPITGEDYLFSLKVIMNKYVNAPQSRTQHDYIEDVIVDPENPKRFTVLTTYPYFRSEFSMGGFEVISKNFYDPEGLLSDISFRDLADGKDIPGAKAFADQFNSDKYAFDPEFIYGSGPYKLESWDRGEQITLVRKKNYWGAAHVDECFCHEAYPEKIIFRVLGDPETAIIELKNEGLDVMRNIPSDKFLEFQEEGNIINDKYNLYSPDMLAYTFIGMNCRPPESEPQVFTDAKTRRAFAHLVDVDGIIEDIYFGFGSPIVGPVSKKRPEYNDKLPLIKLNLEKAKTLLAEAGWKDADGDGVLERKVDGRTQKFEVDFMFPKGSGTAESMALRIAEECKKAGVIVNPAATEFRQMTEKIIQHKFDLFGSGFVLPPLPPDMKQVWHTENWINNGSNYFGFGNAESDSIIKAIREELDAEKRIPYYHKLQEMIYEFQPAVFIRAPQEKLVIHKRFRNARPSEVRPGYSVNRWWVPKDEQIFPKDM